MEESTMTVIKSSSIGRNVTEKKEKRRRKNSKFRDNLMCYTNVTV